MSIEIEEGELQAMLDTLEHSRREMTGTARLLGRQHEAIVGLRDALAAVVTIVGFMPEDQVRRVAQDAINLWGGI